MEKSFTTKQKQQHGFSMVETIIVLALFTVLLLVVSDAIASFYRVNAYTIAQAYQVDHARRGVESLVRDLREMTFADDGTFPLTMMEEHRVGFYSDIDRDDSVEYVEYELSSTTLVKSIFAATGTPPVYSTTTPESVLTISEYVQNDIQGAPMFVYYDGEGVPAVASSTVTDIRYIQVSVIVNIDPVHNPGEYMLRSSASLRNLSD